MLVSDFNKKIMKKILIYILPLILLVSCAKDLTDYNQDQKNPTNVSAGALFGSAIKALVDNQTSASVNINNFRFFVQYWQAVEYQDEPRYNIVTRNTPLNFWIPLYRDALMNFKESKRVLEANELLDEAEKNNCIAVNEISSIYAWSVLVNTWGDVPYSQALDLEGTGRPVYDDAATIYTDLFARLDAAIAMITPEAEGLGTFDLLYGGNMSAWLKFAHSLKLKLAITLADVNPTFAQEAISASADQAFESNADNAAFKYLTSTPNNNPISNSLNIASGLTSRQDYVAARPIVDNMNRLEDPRRPFYFTQLGGQYVGAQPGVPSPFANFSHVSDKIIALDFEALLMDYSEVEFILAEAAARWGIAGSPETHYNNAIKASILYWGGTEAQADTYIEQSGVAYNTAVGDYKEKIGTQKWLALYNRGHDAWVEWKRLDYPRLQPATGAVSGMPVRLTYVTNEYTLNSENVSAAAAKLEGGDRVESKIFWDVN